MQVYFDNAATTPIDPEVKSTMLECMDHYFGNPSSIHKQGREARAQIEKARKTIAAYLNTSPAEIFFTSGGTEADNTAITCSIEAYGLSRAITSPLEHHAVLHPLQHLEKQGTIKLEYVQVDEKGNVDLQHLNTLLKDQPKSLVSLMHGNNEIGNLTDIYRAGEICREHGAIFHSDTVQTVTYYPIDLQEIPVDFITGAAHKFHGPKGTGFLYINNHVKIPPFIHGGAQERNMRGGTENLYGIAGLARAFELAIENQEENRRHIESLKRYMIENFNEQIPDIAYNGNSADINNSMYRTLNVSLPESGDDEMLLFNLDINKISASGGSACSSGTNIGSHVLHALYPESERSAVRFSFSKYNTKEEVDYVINKLKELYTETV